MTPTPLAHAFAVADAIHVQQHDLHHAFFLTLVAVDEHDWAATFNMISDDDANDWYEPYRMGSYPHSARSSDPADAILTAANKLISDLNLKV